MAYRRSAVILALVGSVIGRALAQAATPAQTCQSNKNNAAGKYAYCRQRAEAKFAITGGSGARARALQKCLHKYSLKCSRIESAARGACPSVGDRAPVQSAIDDQTTHIATALAGVGLSGCPVDLSTCQADLVACEGGSPRRFPATGQTTCWNNSGSVISCGGTGQDGDIRAGAALAYTDNGDGTVTDGNTGLMWEKLSEDKSIHDDNTFYSWNDAFAMKMATFIAFAGHTDWRVPNVKELQSIVNYEKEEPAVSPAFDSNCVSRCTVTTCSCPGRTFHWSATTRADFTVEAWWVLGGQVNFGDKRETLGVRAVRGGS
jgi:hypothetical protein